jgi:hypothetical protein
MERVQSLFHDIKRVRVGELRTLIIDSQCHIVHLQVNWSEIIVRIMLMPPNKQIALRLNPIEPVVLARVACS